MIAHWWAGLLRLSFRLLYNELAWSYDLVSWLVSLGEWRQWQKAVLPFLPAAAREGQVLELAHGPGHMLLALAGQGYRVVGLDLSPFMGRQAQRRLRRAGISVPLVRGRGQTLPFAAGTFAAVFTTFPTEFITHPHTIAAIERVLAPGGTFLLVPQAVFRGHGPAARFLEWLYAITGQRAVPADQAAAGSLLAQSLPRSAFHISVETVTLRRSLVTVVVARKLP